MDNNEKKNFLDRIQDYLDSPKGRILLNYLYSWGAAVVICGALFKLTHIPGANLMLFIGMGTEVVVFFISGFERPFIPGKKDDEECYDEAPSYQIHERDTYQQKQSQVKQTESDRVDVDIPVTRTAESSTGSKLNVECVEDVTQEYLDRMRSLTEKMNLICCQSEKIGQSTEEIETLGRNLISINTFYEMHLRSVSSQMNNIDKVNEQTQRMLEQIEELNKVYARMVEAMKVNSHIGNSERL